jgi:GntR family transcriptional regulator
MATGSAAFFLQVSPTSGVPIYRQLLDQIRSQIASGRLPADSFLPSVRQLAQQLQVNPMTVSKAYSLLERDGLVELARGQGMRVLPPSPSTNGKTRRQVLLPLLEQVAASARQLSLPPDEVIALLQPLLKETHHE